MKLLFFLFPALVYADMFILQSEKIEEYGNTFWILTGCKNGYQYTIVKQEPVGSMSIVQDFEKSAHTSKPVQCQSDFKQPSQFPKD